MPEVKRLEVGIFRFPTAADGQKPASAMRSSTAAIWPCCWTASIGKTPSDRKAAYHRAGDGLSGLNGLSRSGRDQPPAFFLPAEEQIRSAMRHYWHEPRGLRCWPTADHRRAIARRHRHAQAAWSWSCWPRCTKPRSRLRGGAHSTGSTCCCAPPVRGRAASCPLSTPTNCCCSRRWPRARTRPRNRRPSRRRNGPKRRCRPHGRRRLPDNLPRGRAQGITSCPRPNAPAPACGRMRVDIGTDRSEQLDYRPSVTVRGRAFCPQVCLPLLQ